MTKVCFGCVCSRGFCSLEKPIQMLLMPFRPLNGSIEAAHHSLIGSARPTYFEAQSLLEAPKPSPSVPQILSRIFEGRYTTVPYCFTNLVLNSDRLLGTAAELKYSNT